MPQIYGLPGVTGADPTKLAEAKSQFYEKVATFESAVGKVQTAVEDVNTTWFGHTNQIFNTEQNQWQIDMQKFNNGVREVGDALGQVGVDYTVLDEPTATSGGA